MRIKYVRGDLLDAAGDVEVDAIAHCCNCFCTMGSGIAPKIKRRWPEVYEADCQTKKGDPKKLGSFSKATVMDGLLTVYNLYGQFGYGKRDQGLRDLNYDALFNALDSMAVDVLVQGGKTVGLPLIGCGLAGGVWHVVEAMIEATLVARGLEVIVYKLD